MPKLDEKNFAEDYGFALSFLKSDAELYKLFKKAVAGTWTPDKFIASVKNTKWYKTHGETYRQNLALKKTDPATYNERLTSSYADVKNKAAALGATLSYKQLQSIAAHTLDFGWSDAHLGDVLSGYIRFTNAKGQAGDNIQAMQQSAWKNGVKVPDASLRTYAQRIAAGDMTVEDFNRQMRHQAASLAPGYADQLKAGMDLYDVASPYMQSMATTLELNPADIDLFDPTIRSALGSRDKDNKPASKTLYEFETSLRNDKRWLGTKNAQDSASGVAHQILSDFGLAT